MNKHFSRFSATLFVLSALLLSQQAAKAQPQFNNVADMLSAVGTNYLTLRRAMTLRTLGLATPGDTDKVVDWRWDATNTLETNMLRLALTGVSTGRLLRDSNGDVKDFGAKGDWNETTQTGTDNTAALQAAFNHAQYTKRVRFSQGNYYTLGAITNTNSVVISFDDGAKWYRATNQTGPSLVIKPAADPTFYQRFSTDLRRGNQSFTMTDTTGFQAGDWIMIRDRRSRNPNGTAADNPNMEINRIRDINGTTVTPIALISGDYRLSDTNEIAKLQPLDVIIQRFNLECQTNNSTAGGIFFNYVTSTRMDNAHAEGCWSPAFHWQRSAHIAINNSTAYRGNGVEFGGTGYGFYFSRGTHNYAMHGCITIGVRENQSDSGARDGIIEGCHFIGHYDDGFNSHGQGVESLLIVNNIIDQCRGYGLLASFNGANWYDSHITIRGNHIQANLSGVYVSASAGTNEYVYVEDNRIRAQRYGIEIDKGGKGLYVSRNHIYPWGTGAGQGIYVTNTSKAKFLDNEVFGLSSGFGLHFTADSSNNVVRGFYATDCTTPYNVQVLGNGNTLSGLNLVDNTGIGYWDSGTKNELSNYRVRRQTGVSLYLSAAQRPTVSDFIIDDSSDSTIISNTAYATLRNGRIYANTANAAHIRIYANNTTLDEINIDGSDANTNIANGDVGFYYLSGTNNVQRNCSVWPQNTIDNAIYLSTGVNRFSLKGGQYGGSSGAIPRIIGGAGVQNDLFIENVNFRDTAAYVIRPGGGSNWRIINNTFENTTLPVVFPVNALTNATIALNSVLQGTAEADFITLPAGSTHMAFLNTYSNTPQASLTLPVLAKVPGTPNLGNFTIYGGRTNTTNQSVVIKWENGATNNIIIEP